MKKILILTLSLLTINLVSKAQVELTSTSVGATYYVTVPGAFVLTPGLQVTFKANVDNSASMSLDVSGTGAKPIRKLGNSQPLSGSDILTNQIVTVAYDGSNWQMISALGSTPTAPTNYWSPNGSDIYNNNASEVGIGKSTPVSNLDVAGDINSDDVYKLDGTTFLSNWNGNILVGNTLTTTSLTGIYNTFIGEGAGQNTTTPARNTFLGRYAGNSNITGSDNTSLGAQAASNANSSYNTSIGAYSNTGLTSGQYNASLGYSSGQNNTTGSNNTFLGYNADASVNNLTNATAIGSNATVSQNNSLILGNAANVGIGTNAPAQKLEIQDGHILLSNTGTQSELRFKEASANGGNIISFKAPAALTSNVNYTLPINVGVANDILSNDGTGTLSWITPAASVNIYNSNGALTGARTVTQGANTLAFTASAVNAFSVDGTTFSIDALNNYVGIGTAPALPLDVANSTQTTTTRFRNSLNSASPKMAVYGWADGLGTGNNFAGVFDAYGSTGTNYAVYGAASGNSGTKTAIYGNATGTGTNVGGYFSASGGTTNNALQLVDGSQANNRVLTSDASGMGTWTDLTTLTSGGATAWTRAGTSIYPTSFSTDNVAIGTTNPANNNLYVYRPNTAYGAGYSNIYGYRQGSATATNGGTSWAVGSVDAAVKGYSDYGNNYTAGVAGYMFLDYNNSAGVFGSNQAGTIYGALAIKDNAGTSWAGYFGGSNVYIQNNLGIGTTNPLFPLEITTSTLLRGSQIQNSFSSASAKYGIYAIASGGGAGDNNGGWFDATGSTTINTGVGAQALGSAVNRAIYGYASGGTTNWAGYFASGNVYIQNKIRIGSSTTTPTEVIHVSTTDSDIDLETYSTTESSSLHIKRGRGSVAAPSIPASGDYYGGVGFQAWDGTAFQEGARIQGVVDGVVGATDMPGRLEFLTSPDATATAIERMRITNGGNVGIGTTAPGTSRLNVVIPSTDATNGVGITVTNNYTGASAKYGIDVNVDGAGSGTKYGISSSVIGLAGDASTIYGYQVAMTPNGTGGSYGIYSSQSGVGTGTRYGIYSNVAHSTTSTTVGYGVYSLISKPAGASGNTFAGYFSSSNAGTGTAYGIYTIGEDYNYFSNRVGIGTAAPGGQLQLTLDEGRKISTNTWTIVSDERLKNIDGQYTKGLKEILNLNPIMYHYKNVGEKTFEKKVLDTQSYGFSAQEVQKIFPESVGIDEDGYLNFNIHAILVAYVNAIKEQQKMIEELKKEVEALKNK